MKLTLRENEIQINQRKKSNLYTSTLMIKKSMKIVKKKSNLLFDSLTLSVLSLTSTKENFDGKNFFDLRRVFHINHTNLLILNLV